MMIEVPGPRCGGNDLSGFYTCLLYPGGITFLLKVERRRRSQGCRLSLFEVLK